MITVSSPGKIHLLGEHVVIYGRPALLAAIDRKIYVEIRDQILATRRKEDILVDSPYGDNLIKHSVDVFKKAFSIKKLPSIEIKITSQLPVGSGLGSSAAVSAGMIGALMKFVKNIWNPVRINELTYEVEKIAHGNPSGADNTAVTLGGLVWFRREFDASTSLSINPELLESERPRSRRPVERVDFLKSIWSLPVSSYKIPHFVLLDCGKPKETTKEMIESVARLYRKNRKKMEEVFSSQEQQTKRLLLALRSGDKRELTGAIRLGERNLEKMGVVGSKAEEIIREIESYGGAAKVCGGGGKKEGSGMLLCYHERLSVIKKIGEKYKAPVSPVKLGGEGIRLENHG